jgi:hypothetical protein
VQTNWMMEALRGMEVDMMVCCVGEPVGLRDIDDGGYGICVVWLVWLYSFTL